MNKPAFPYRLALLVRRQFSRIGGEHPIALVTYIRNGLCSLFSKGAYPSNGGGAGAGPGAVAYEEETVDGGGGARKEPADGPESRPEAGTPDEVVCVDLIEG